LRIASGGDAWTLAGGPAHVFARRNFNTFEGGAAVGAGASRLISRDAGVGNIQNPPAQAGAVTARFEHALRYYRAQRSIEVSLDLKCIRRRHRDRPGHIRLVRQIQGLVRCLSAIFARFGVGGWQFPPKRVRDAREEGFDALAKDDARTSASLLMACRDGR